MKIDSSLEARTARLGTVYDRLLLLTAAERAYRKGGDQRTAGALAAERVDVLDELTSGERDEMLLIVIGRNAPQLHLCNTCRTEVTSAERCEGCRADVGSGVLDLVNELLAAVQADAQWANATRAPGAPA